MIDGFLALLGAPGLRLWLSVGARAEVRGALRVHGGGDVIVGKRVLFDGVPVAVELLAHPGATIVLGDGCVLEGGCSIEATRSIRIGAGCHLDAFSKIMDNHFHNLDGDRHLRPHGSPVVLEDGVRLGPHSIVLAGARIGRGTRVGPATVIRRSLPTGLCVRGSPPAVVREPRPS